MIMTEISVWVKGILTERDKVYFFKITLSSSAEIPSSKMKMIIAYIPVCVLSLLAGRACYR
jgi:hypothetical protein